MWSVTKNKLSRTKTKWFLHSLSGSEQHKLEPPSQLFPVSKQYLRSMEFNVWCHRSNTPWDSGWYALDTTCWTFNVLTTSLKSRDWTFVPWSLSLRPWPCLHLIDFVTFCLLYYTTPITTPYPCNHTNTPDNTDWNTLLSLRFRLLINHLKHCLLSAHKPKTLQLMTDCSVSWATAAPQYNEPLRWLVCYYRILCFMLCCQETRMNTRKMLCESSVLLQDSAHGTETNCCLKMRLLHHFSFLQLKNCDNEGCAPQGFVI